MSYDAPNPLAVRNAVPSQQNIDALLECEKRSVNFVFNALNDDPVRAFAMLEEMFPETIVDMGLINILSDMPKDISPLAKTHRNNPRLVEHFDTYLLGMELGCAYSELSNPLEQLERFKSQMDERENGDDEAQMLDESFIDALSYGFVPTTGMGMGMDRLAKLLTGAATLRDVILFPTLKKI